MKLLWVIFLIVFLYLSAYAEENTLSSIIQSIDDYGDYRDAAIPILKLDSNNQLHLLYLTYPNLDLRYKRFNLETGEQLRWYGWNTGFINNSVDNMYIAGDGSTYIIYEADNCSRKLCVVDSAGNLVDCICPYQNFNVNIGCVLSDNCYLFLPRGHESLLEKATPSADLVQVSDSSWHLPSQIDPQHKFYHSMKMHIINKNDSIIYLVNYLYVPHNRIHAQAIGIIEYDIYSLETINSRIIDFAENDTIFKTHLFCDDKIRGFRNPKGGLTIYTGYLDSTEAVRLCRIELDSNLNMAADSRRGLIEYKNIEMSDIDIFDNQMIIFEKFTSKDRIYSGQFWRYIETDRAIYYSQSKPISSNVEWINK